MHSDPTTVAWNTLIVERGEGLDAGILTITLNRPHRKNAMSNEMFEELHDVFHYIGDANVDRVVVLTGAPGAFCSGADLGGGEGSPANPAVNRHQLQQMRRVSAAGIKFSKLPMPVIAKVNGVAAGAGANLALLCDLIVAGSSARFSEIFAKRGLSIDFGGSWVLPRLIGLHRAKELAFFADIISAAEAKEFGLVNRVVPDEELDAFVTAWARRLAAGPPIALAQTKLLLNNSFESSFEQALEHEGAAQTVNFGTKDTVEAMMAFIQKRDPKFSGE
jgi:enoyl-CoA hydratase/carnithine racemase